MEAKLLFVTSFLIILLGLVVSEDTRIYGGYKIDITRAPYMATIVITEILANGSDSKHYCGGTILRRNLILTVAHCTVSPESHTRITAAQYTVIVGTNSYDSGRTRHSVRTVFTHPKYISGGNFFYDVGLLELNGYVTLNARVRLVNLARRTDRPKIGAECTATGYGLNPQNPQTKTLYQVHLNVISAEQCSREFGDGTATEIDQHFICVKSAGKSPCPGDSGGPLHDVSTKRQIGIVSNGNETCTTYYPTKFTRVTDVLDFITEVIRRTTRRR